MVLAQVHGVVLSGIDGVLVRVEVDVSDGLPGVSVVGLPDASVTEARSRVRCAVDAIGAAWPNRRITISLSPADVRKHGSGLDLPIAIGVLAAAEVVPAGALASTAFVGELGLDGGIRPARGALPGALAARRGGLSTLVIPSDGARELGRLTGLRVLLADHLAEVVRLLGGTGSDRAWSPAPPAPDDAASGPDLRDVRGQGRARLGLEVAAAGGHHLAMVGPPGVGKTLLAERLPGLLPDLSDDLALEVAAVHSVAGQPRADSDYARPPLRAPHHSASAAAVLGSVRTGRVVPGAVTLAHGGVLVLDEAPEFPRNALEGLRQPLEAGAVYLDRAGWSGWLPARFQLVLAANPCPCGRRIGTGLGCSCAPAAIRRYASRLSGPLLDRIDVRMVVTRPSDAELSAAVDGEPTRAVRDRVLAARERAGERLRDSPWRTNAEVPATELRRRWRPDAAGADVLRTLERGSANLRGPDRVLRVAWTLADLAGRGQPGRDEVAMAAALRGSGTAWAA